MLEVPVADEADLVVRFGVSLGWEGGGSGHSQLQDEIFCAITPFGSLMKLRDLFPKKVLILKIKDLR